MLVVGYIFIVVYMLVVVYTLVVVYMLVVYYTTLHTHCQVSIDPGERGSPSGESSPSSTPNNTLSKQANRHMIVDSFHGNPKLGILKEGENHCTFLTELW